MALSVQMPECFRRGDMLFEGQPMFTHAPELEVLVIGAGFSGLCMAIELRKAGVEQFLILEQASEIGGTWRDNHYPGCACDIPSQLYSYSFEPNPNWSRRYAPQREIQAYLQHCVRKYGLEPYLRLSQSVTSLQFDEQSDCWEALTQSGQRYRARVVVSGMGALSRPALPDVPGLDRFQGTAFHSAEWRHDHDLRGKRVAVIGTGASAIQFVPQIAPQVAQLDVYQRSAPWVIAKADRPLRAWEKTLFRLLPPVQKLMRLAVYWKLESRLLGFVLSPRLMQLAARKALKHLESQIADPVLRKKLTPQYAFGCKRILISDDFYPALTRPNVALIGEAIREVREHSVVTEDGQERPVDTLIFGTGFRAQDPVPQGMIRGVGGVELHERWPQGPEAFLGLSVAGFPNLFFMVGPNTGLAHNSMVYMIEAQVRYVIDSLRSMRRSAWSRVEVQAGVQQGFNEGLQARLGKTVWSSGCRSWYVNDQGRNTLLWPGSTFSYRRLTRRFEAQHYLCRSRQETVT